MCLRPRVQSQVCICERGDRRWSFKLWTPSPAGGWSTTGSPCRPWLCSAGEMEDRPLPRPSWSPSGPQLTPAPPTPPHTHTGPSTTHHMAPLASFSRVPGLLICPRGGCVGVPACVCVLRWGQGWLSKLWDVYMGPSKCLGVSLGKLELLLALTFPLPSTSWDHIRWEWLRGAESRKSVCGIQSPKTFSLRNQGLPGQTQDCSPAFG